MKKKIKIVLCECANESSNNVINVGLNLIAHINVDIMQVTPTHTQARGKCAKERELSYTSTTLIRPTYNLEIVCNQRLTFSKLICHRN